MLALVKMAELLMNDLKVFDLFILKYMLIIKTTIA